MGDDAFHELWGTFSVRDHLRDRPFLSEVLLYDRLVIPIPPSKEPVEWERWEQNNWNPQRLMKLLPELGEIAYPVEWTSAWRGTWAGAFEERRGDLTDYVTKELAFQVTGETLLKVTPAMAQGVVAAVPFASLEEAEKELAISPTQPHAQLPPGTINAMLGRELLVPEYGDKDDFESLREAVSVATSPDYRNARFELYQWQRKFIKGGTTDRASVEGALKEMNARVQALEKANRKRDLWKATRRVFFLAQIVVSAAVSPVFPIALGTAAIAIGAFTATEKLADPSNPYAKVPEAALIVDARRRLDMRPIQ